MSSADAALSGAQPAMLRVRWFDGRSALPQPALAWLSEGAKGPVLHWHPVEGGTGPFMRAGGDVGWPERFSPRHRPERITVDLRGDGTLEVDDVQGWYDAFAAAGATHGLADRMQSHWHVFAGVAVLAIAAIFAFYRWGTPWAAAQLSRHVPVGWELTLSERALRDMDQHWFKPSKLPAERQALLRARFEQLVAQVPPELRRYPGYAPRMQLHFRNGLGANALAMPGGIVIMTDGLAEMADKHALGDDALLGVLAHEAGHVLHRHTTRMVVEQGVLNVGLGLALGDVSWIVSSGSTLLTTLAYSRSHEGEADCFAVGLMRRAKLPTAPMGELLLRISAGDGEGGKPDAKAARPAPREASALEVLLSSHPDTPARAKALQQGQAC
jgi:Zn-dependent protease with chaperone function